MKYSHLLSQQLPTLIPTTEQYIAAILEFIRCSIESLYGEIFVVILCKYCIHIDIYLEVDVANIAVVYDETIR